MYSVKFGEWCQKDGKRYWTGTKEDLILAKNAGQVSDKDRVIVHERTRALGEITMSVLPALPGFLLCDGRQFDKTVFKDLYEALGDDHTPDLREAAPVGAGTRASGAAAHDAFAAGQFKDDAVQTLPDVTISVPGHTHGLNSHTHSLNSHTHSLNSHTHTFTPSGSINSQGAHTHTRGDMDITGQIILSQEINGTYADKWAGVPNGAFSIDETFGDGVDGNNGRFEKTSFKASRSWTGSTSENGSHSHNFTGSAGTTGAASGNTGASSGDTGASSGSTEGAAWTGGTGPTVTFDKSGMRQQAVTRGKRFGMNFFIAY